MLEASSGQYNDLPESEREKFAQARFAKMTPIEQRSMIQATAQMVRFIAVSPRLVLGEVNGHKDAISVDALTMSDFKCLSKWAEGGDAAPGLKTFRHKRR
jgi:hypothetical protein